MEFGGQFLRSIECRRSLRFDPWETAGQIEWGPKLEGRTRQGLGDTWWPPPHLPSSHLATFHTVGA